MFVDVECNGGVDCREGFVLRWRNRVVDKYFYELLVENGQTPVARQPLILSNDAPRHATDHIPKLESTGMRRKRGRRKKRGARSRWKCMVMVMMRIQNQDRRKIRWTENIHGVEEDECRRRRRGRLSASKTEKGWWIPHPPHSPAWGLFWSLDLFFLLFLFWFSYYSILMKFKFPSRPSTCTTPFGAATVSFAHFICLCCSRWRKNRIGIDLDAFPLWASECTNGIWIPDELVKQSIKQISSEHFNKPPKDDVGFGMVRKVDGVTAMAGWSVQGKLSRSFSALVGIHRLIGGRQVFWDPHLLPFLLTFIHTHICENLCYPSIYSLFLSYVQRILTIVFPWTSIYLNSLFSPHLFLRV